MKIIPLAADSLGVRSMATYVEVGGTGILIDPGATLGPSRFNLPPSAAEWEAFRRANDRISAWAARASIVFVSHYHEDHFRADPVMYAGRRVLAKDPRRMVTGLQARRATEFVKALDGRAHVESADGLARRESSFELRVSAPLPHGPEGTAQGSVLALTVSDPAERDRFVFASDVQGAMSPVVAAYLVQERPTLVYLSGPPSYIEHEIGTPLIDRAIDNLLRVIDRTGCRVIMDHHAVRDVAFESRFERLWKTGRVMTAARWLGVAESTLERSRRHLWAGTRKPPAAAPRTGISRATMARTVARSVKGGRVP
jgi:uncharacterized protein